MVAFTCFFPGSVFHFSLLLGILSHPSRAWGKRPPFSFPIKKKNNCASFKLPLGNPEFFRSWLQLMLCLDHTMNLGLESANWFGLYHSFIQRNYWVSVMCQVRYRRGASMVTSGTQRLLLQSSHGDKSTGQQALADHTVICQHKGEFCFLDFFHFEGFI